MPGPLSKDIRDRIIAALEAGQSTRAVARRFDVSQGVVWKLKKQQQETGNVEIKTGPRGPKPRLDAYTDQILAIVERSPDATAAEMRDKLPVKVSVVTVWRQLRKLNLTFKKNDTSR